MPEKIDENSTDIADDAGRDELQVAALARFLEDRAEAEPERQQVEQRLAERRDDLRARPRVALELAQPEDVDRRSRHRLHIFATCRIWSAASARSSRIVEPVSARNACSSESVLGLLLQLLRRCPARRSCRDR